MSAAEVENYLSGTCQSFGITAESPIHRKLHIGTDAQEAQGKDNILKQQGLWSVSVTAKHIRKSLHISSAATTDFQSL